MRQLSRNLFALLGILCLLTSAIQGQSLNIYNISEAETRECTWNPHDIERTVLRGEAYIPSESGYSSFIFFDGGSKNSGYQQLCLINTATNCQDLSGFPECYCMPSDAVNMYTFVVNLTEESMNDNDFIRAYLLSEDSRRLNEVELPLHTLQSNKLAVTTDLTINGESVGAECNKTITGNHLILKAECKEYLTSCWLELDINETEESVISSEMIAYHEIFKDESSVTLTLRRSVCGKDKFEIIHTCTIDFVQDTALLEGDTTNIIIIVCVLVPLTLIGTVIGIILYNRRRKHVKKHAKPDIEESTEEIEKESLQNPNKSEDPTPGMKNKIKAAWKEIKDRVPFRKIENEPSQNQSTHETAETKAFLNQQESHGDYSIENNREECVVGSSIEKSDSNQSENDSFQNQSMQEVNQFGIENEDVRSVSSAPISKSSSFLDFEENKQVAENSLKDIDPSECEEAKRLVSPEDEYEDEGSQCEEEGMAPKKPPRTHSPKAYTFKNESIREFDLQNTEEVPKPQDKTFHQVSSYNPWEKLKESHKPVIEQLKDNFPKK